MTVEGSAQPIPARGTLVVDPAQANGAQQWRRYIDPSKPPSEFSLVFGPVGPMITETVQRTSFGSTSVDVTCTFAPPLPAPPWPPTLGRTFSSNGKCGASTAQVSGRVDGMRTASVGGAPVSVVVLDSTITTHGQIASTDAETDWYAPALGLSVHEETQLSGQDGLFSFAEHVVSDLEATAPS